MNDVAEYYVLLSEDPVVSVYLGAQGRRRRLS